MPDHPDYVVSAFSRAWLNLYAHDSYLAAHGLPTSEDDLEGHMFVVPKDRNTRLPFAQWIDRNVRPEMIALSTRSIRMGAEAISAGLGMGFVSDHEAQARGGFNRVLPSNEAWTVPLWLVTHVDLHRTEKVQAMLSCIKSARQFQG
jgi:DNA-binding transcriptional LysR family regulator